MKCPLPVQMRTSPSITIVGTMPAFDGSGGANFSSVNSSWLTPELLEFDANLSASLTTGRAAMFYNDQSSSSNIRSTQGIEIDAEL